MRAIVPFHPECTTANPPGATSTTGTQSAKQSSTGTSWAVQTMASQPSAICSANVLKIIGAVRGHRHDMVTMYLIGHEQIMLALSGTHGFECSTTIFLNGEGVIAYMRAQVERGVRIFGNATGALGKGKANIVRRALYQRNSIMVDTRNVVRTCCHTKAS